MLTLLLAAADPTLDPGTGRGPEWGKAAPVALLIIALMGIALFLLIRSMNSQLRKVPGAFVRGPGAASRPGAEPDATTATRDPGAPGDETPPDDRGSTGRP